ncbi:MAG: ABC transporter substrate-binding protein [Actinomycetota bacterium]
MLRRALIALAVVALIAAACTNEPEEPEGETGGGTTGTTTGTTGESGPYAELAAAMAGEYEGTEVEVIGIWIDAEALGMEAALAPFEEATGIDVRYEGLTDYETVLRTRVTGGDPPDIANIPQPGLMREFAADGALVNLSEFWNLDQLNEDYIESWIELGTGDDGNLYGVYYKADLKSIVWYPPAAFEEAGYAIPQTWSELESLTQQIKDDGGNPWCIAMEHGEASGWVATDWIEDILLRTAPLEVYDQWVAHEIPFDHPEVVEAATIMHDIWFTQGNVFGGSQNINSVFVGDAMNPMFEGDCWLHKQASWIPGFWPGAQEGDPQYTAGEDAAFFYLPPIEEEFGKPLLGGGDQMVMFDDRPEVRALLQFLATPEGAQGWIDAHNADPDGVGGFLAANRNVPVDWYQTYPQADLAEIAAEATALRFDASDTMPAEVGAGTFWTGMVDWVAADGDDTEDVLHDIEESWPA